MTSLKQKADEAKAARAKAELELAAMYAKAAADPTCSRVLADIAGHLANPDFPCEGLGSRSDGFLARYREASRIDLMIRAGRAGVKAA